MTDADPFFADPELAQFYDELCANTHRDDYDFYLPFIMAADRVIDIGCGTGLLLKDARDRGHQGQLAGVDPAPGMIGIAQQYAGIEWHLGELTADTVGTGYDLAVMTGHAFQVLLEDPEIDAFLGEVRAVLTDGGRFVFETRNASAQDWTSWTTAEDATVRDKDDIPVRTRRDVIAPFDGDRITFTHSFDHPDWSEPRMSTSTLRFLSQTDLNDRLRRAGFEVDAQFGDWDRSPVTDASPEIITIARAIDGGRQ